jgi:hypothetical protein
MALAYAPIFNLQSKLQFRLRSNGMDVSVPFFLAELIRVGLSNPNAPKATIQDVLEANLNDRKLEEPTICTCFGKTWPYSFPITELDFCAGDWSTGGKSHGCGSSAS